MSAEHDYGINAENNRTETTTMIQFLKDVKNMHWAARLILILVVLKALAAVYREQAIF